MERPAIPREASGNVAGRIRQAQMLQSLNKASLAVQQAHTPDEVYDAVIEEMGLLGYRTLILERSIDGKYLHVVRMGATAQVKARFRRLTGLSPDAVQISLNSLPNHERIFERKETLFVQDIVSLVRMILPEPARLLAQNVTALLSLEHSIVAPLEVVGHVRGVVLVSADALSHADLPAVTAFARQISTALEQALLFAELREREWRSTIAYEMTQEYARELKDRVREERKLRAELDRLNRALRLFADRLQHRQDERAIAQLLCDAVHDAMGWQQATVSLLDYETMTWHAVAQVGHRHGALEQRMPILPTPPDQAPWQREEFRISHSYYVPATLDQEEKPGEPNGVEPGRSRDSLIVFLEAGGRTLGVLLPTGREDGQPPTRQQVEHLELFATQAAIAIESNRLSKSVQMWADAVRHSGDAIFIADVEGKILNANPAFEALTGYDLVGALNQTVLTLQSSLTPPNVYAEMWNTIQSGKSWRGEVINLRKDGSAYDADLTVAPIVGVDGEVIGFVGSQRDITPMKELDRLKSQFVSNVSHELRTPLTNIKLYQRYLRENRRPNLRDRFFDILERETMRLEQIIESLLDLSRLETGIRAFRSEVIDLNDLAASVVVEHQPAARSRGLSLVFEPSPELSQVRADRQQMAVVLGNLLTNALSYTPEGGSVRVTTQQNRESVLLSVHDSGCGIAPEEIGHIFERFYRGQASESLGIAGAGLGLSIVKQILELHHGTIGVDSHLDQGTVFTVTLPTIECSSSASPLILLIADNPDEMSAMQEQLVEAGCWVLLAVSEKEALARLAKETPDLIVLDQMSSRQEGDYLLEKIAPEGNPSSPPVLVVTETEQEPGSSTLASGKDGASVRFVSQAALLPAIHHALGWSEEPQR